MSVFPVGLNAGRDPGDALMRTMVGYWDAHLYSGSGNWLNLGTAGAAGDMILGAATAAPTFGGTLHAAGFTFDGTNDTMGTAANIAAFTAPNKFNDFSVGVILTPLTATFLGRTIYQGSDSGGGAGWSFAGDGASLGLRVYINDATHIGFTSASALSNGVQSAVIGGLQAAGNRFARVKSGGASTTADGRTAGSSNAIKLFIGSGNGSSFQNVKIHGAFVHQGALTTQQIVDICAHWGI